MREFRSTGWRTARAAAALAVALAVALTACDGGGDDAGPGGSGPTSYDPLVDFDTIAVAITTASDTLRISAELADNDDRRAYGLMERAELPEQHGMLFVYPEPRDSTGSFWMYRTEIPLDIAFLDRDGEIVAILGMEPCESPNPRYCRHYSPGVPFQAALEMNRGYFDRHGVGVGDRVRALDGEVGGAGVVEAAEAAPDENGRMGESDE